MAKRGATPAEHTEATTWWQGVAETFGIGRRRPRRRARRSTLPSHYAPLGRSSRRRPPHGQAHRDGNYRAYLVGFGVIIVILAAFLYVGLSWATGPGRTAAMVPAAAAPAPPPQPPATAPATDPTPTASPAAEQTYVVKAGDTPVAIAQRFKIKVEDLLAANNITNPRSLQVGQLLKIPPPPNG